jgi:protein tyrosine phosphatase (PTP) superfamily phosphohydrolase (DUF442 family)
MIDSGSELHQGTSDELCFPKRLTIMMGIATPALLCLAAMQVDGKETSAERPSAWAKPIQADGLPNLHQVSDALYRSAQPTADGMRKLTEMGVVTVINLRSFHSDRKLIGNTGLAYEHIYMKAWHPEKKEVVRFLQIVTDPKRTPVLLHCQHGADRTGTMCALYRVVVDGWTKERAIEEMTGGGFGFHQIWKNLPDWILELDVEAIRSEAGLTRSGK